MNATNRKNTMSICPFAPYTTNEIANLEDALTALLLNQIWQKQGCKISKTEETKMMGDYC